MSKDHIDHNALIDILYLPVRRRVPSRPKTVIVAVWPCGTRWTLEADGRREWSCPHFENGEQTGLTTVATTRRELMGDLPREVRFERVDAAEERARIWGEDD